jgi:PAS domain-containing protein
MDIRIEGDLDGIETAEIVTKRYSIPIIYLTAHSDEKTLERAMATQPHGYLIKPFRLRELYSTIEIALYKHRLMTKSPEASAAVPSPAAKESAIHPATVTLERAVLDVMDIPVFVVNRDLKIVFLNPACEMVFSQIGFQGPYLRHLLPEIAPPPLVGFAREYAGIFETGNPKQNQVSVVIDGKPVSFSVRKIPVSEQGTVTYVVIAAVDVSREHRIDDQIAQMYAQNEDVLVRLSEITALTSGKDDPDMKKIADNVGEIVIAITRQVSQKPE